MDLFNEALSITGMSLVMVFGVLILLMWAMQLSAAIFERAGQKSAEKTTTPATRAPSPRVPVESGVTTDDEHTAVILAALEAAQIDVPQGGRVRIEKISRRS